MFWRSKMINRLVNWAISVNPALWESVSILAFVIFITFMVGVN